MGRIAIHLQIKHNCSAIVAREYGLPAVVSVENANLILVLLGRMVPDTGTNILMAVITTSSPSIS